MSFANNDRKYRKPITVGTASSVVTDYQVKVTVDFVSGKMNSDFSDLLFTDVDGNNLSYWVESKTDDVSAIVWIKITTTSTSSSQTIYMYYGKVGVASASNILNTMLTGDDFNDNSISRMTIESGTWSVSGGILSETVGAASNNIIKPNTNPAIQNAIYEARMRVDAKRSGSGGSDWWAGIVGRNPDTTGSVDPGGYVGQFGARASERAGIERFNYAHLAYVDKAISLSTFYRLKFVLNGNTKTVYIDGTKYGEDTGDTNYPSANKTILRSFNARIGIDFFFVRQFVSTEPSISTGVEEIRPSSGFFPFF